MRCSGSRCMIRCNAEASISCLAGRRPSQPHLLVCGIAEYGADQSC